MGFRVWGLWFRFLGLGVSGLECMDPKTRKTLRVEGQACASDPNTTKGLQAPWGRTIPKPKSQTRCSLGFRVEGSGFRVLGLRLRV